MRGLAGVIAIFWLVLASPVRAASVLETAATALANNAWVQISTTNTNLLQQPGAGGTIADFAANASWDPVRKRLYYVGNDHIDSITSQDQRFVYYDEATNAWANLPQGWSAPGQTDHGYYHNGAINTRTGIFYRRHGKDSQTLERFNLDTHSWTTALPANTLLSFTQCCGGMSYFPEAGGLFWIQGDGGPGGAGACGGNNCARLSTFNETTNVWVNIAQNIPMFDQPVVMAYNSVSQVIIYGRENSFYKMDRNRTITQFATAPITFYNGGFLAVIMPDPASGDFMVLDPGTRNLWRFNPLTGAWAAQSSTNKPNLNNLSIFAAPIANYGVIMYVACTTSCATYLYKPTTDAATTNYQTRILGRGVFKTFGFDNAALDRGTVGASGFGANYGTYYNGQGTGDPCPTSGSIQCPVIDTSIKASGASSLKFTIPTNSGAGGSGQWFTNFSRDLSLQFGGNSTLIAQWRQRFSPCFIRAGANDTACAAAAQSATRQYSLIDGQGGWKQLILGTGDNGSGTASSCTNQETVTQNTAQRGFPQGYHSCVTFSGFEPNTVPPNDILFQNQRASPYCRYNGGTANYFSPGGNCFGYFPNEWMSFKTRIDIGAFTSAGGCTADAAGLNCYKNSRVRQWVGREGDAAMTLIIDITRDMIAAPEPNGNNQWGKVWLLPYHTNKSSSQAHPEAYTWYDELILSTQDIADPGAVAAGPTPQTFTQSLSDATNFSEFAKPIGPVRGRLRRVIERRLN